MNTISSPLIKAFKPRALEHWGRNIGAYNRCKIQGLSWAKDLLAGGKMLVDPARLAASSLSLEKRILNIQEAPYKYLDLSPDPIVLLDKLGRFVFFNSEAERITGFDRTQMVGTTFAGSGIVSEKSLSAASEAFLQALEGKRIEGLELTIIGMGGGEIIVELNARKVGREVYVALRDITERKRAEMEKKQSAFFVSAIHVLSGMRDFLSNKLGPIHSNLKTIFEICDEISENAVAIIENSQDPKKTDAFSNINNALREIKEAVADSNENIEISFAVMRLIRALYELVRTKEGHWNKFEELNLTGLLSSVINGIRSNDKILKITEQEPDIQFSSSLPEGLKIKATNDHIKYALETFVTSAINAAKLANKPGRRVEIKVSKKPNEIEIVISDNGWREIPLTLERMEAPPFISQMTHLYIEDLNLSLALAYIKAHGGTCAIESETETGSNDKIAAKATKIMIRLPYQG